MSGSVLGAESKREEKIDKYLALRKFNSNEGNKQYMR